MKVVYIVFLIIDECYTCKCLWLKLNKMLL